MCDFINVTTPGIFFVNELHCDDGYFPSIKGVKFMTSREALGALINRQVQGTLLEYNEAANLQSTISANGLKISKKIASTSGVGFVLSDSMASFHKQIRSYVATNYNLIQSLVKNFTKEVVVSIHSFAVNF